MDPLSVLAAAQAVSGAVQAGASYFGAKDANIKASESVDRQMAFQERMENTRWQRGRRDLEAAGYNPALAYSQGPAGAAAGASFAPENEFAGIGELSRGTSGALESLSMASQIKVNQANAALMAANAKQAEANTEILKGKTPEAQREGEFYSDGAISHWIKPLIFIKSLLK